MPAPNLRLTSGVGAAGDRLYGIVRERIAAELAAQARAEALRKQRAAEALDDRRVKVTEGQLGVNVREAGVKEKDAEQKATEWKHKLDNPEVEVVRGVGLRGGDPTVELVRKLGGAPVRTLGYDYNVTPQTLTVNEQIAAEGPNKGKYVTRVLDQRNPGGEPLYENEQYVRPVTGSGGGSGDGEDAAEVAGIARMVMGNPDLLKEMNPVLRGKVLGEISKNPEPFRLGRQRLLDQVLGETEEAIIALRNHPGLAASTGAPSLTDPGSLTRLIPGVGPMAGSKAAGATAARTRLVSLLTAPRLDLMRGLGAMSEVEFGTMQKGATTLDSNLPDSEVIAELDRLLPAVRAARARARIGQAGPISPTTAAAPGAAPGAAPAPGAARPVLDRDSLRQIYGF